mgnify:CR=1 FL=1
MESLDLTKVTVTEQIIVPTPIPTPIPTTLFFQTSIKMEGDYDAIVDVEQWIIDASKYVENQNTKCTSIYKSSIGKLCTNFKKKLILFVRIGRFYNCVPKFVTIKNNVTKFCIEFYFFFHLRKKLSHF